jgi:1-deoxy-D-xylulose-5-phosphate reductoisomerase
MKAISILGSTGSIGCNTLKVVEHLRDHRVVALGSGRNVAILAEQIAKFKPELVSVADDTVAEKLSRKLSEANVNVPRIVTGEKGLTEVATHEEADVVVSAAVGAVGFIPTLKAVESGKRVALANKETLVMGGELIMSAARNSGAEILPIDSEHNALHQCLRGENISDVKRLILTASGGPFLNRTKGEIESATIDQALAHPNWKMGNKITIDSATLMNKGLEVIEAHWLFGFDADRISVVIHPQSVVHSMIEMVDGSVIAQLGVTDMKHAIQYALTCPERIESCVPALDFRSLRALSFEEPDTERFPCLDLAYEALRMGGTAPAALNASNEVAVEAFLSGEIGFGEIASINRRVLSIHQPKPAADLDTILSADKESRSYATQLIREPVTAVPAQTV